MAYAADNGVSRQWSSLAAAGSAWGQDAAAVLHDAAFAGESLQDALPLGAEDLPTPWDGGLGQALTGRLDEVRLVSVGRRLRGTLLAAAGDEDAAPDTARLADGLPQSGLPDRDAVDAVFGLSPGEGDRGQESAVGLYAAT